MVHRLDVTAVAAFALPFVLYAFTLAPTLYNLDSAEFTTAVATNGLIRATGYPLYLLLGKLWSWLPLGGDMGYQMNLFSAFNGAITLLLAERIMQQLGVGAWARLAAVGLLATAPYFWALSLIAEVYTLHTALMAGVILALLRWAAAPTPLRLALPILLMTLSLGNHAATVLLAPGCVWYVLTRHPRLLRRWRTWAVGVGAILLGSTIFLLLPMRYAAQPVFNYAGQYDAAGVFQPANLQTWDGIWWLITGQTFAGQMFGYRLADVWPQAAGFGVQLWAAFFAIGVGPGVAGALALLRRDWRSGGMLLLMFLANAVFYINYRVIDKNTMFLPAYLIFALWVGVGYQLLLSWAVQQERPFPARQLIRYVMVGAVVLAAGFNWRLVDLSEDWSTREQAEAILRLVEPDALVLGWWDTAPSIQYLQLVEGERPDVTVINRFLISPEDMNRLILTEINRRPVYINNPSIELLQRTTAVAVGPLYRLEPRNPGPK
ncbi:MAG: DUF2723 domain-containing protein [Anaerolineales bacterium]|nr:DUF2723 domain-containing protein [Anaerolineales bacterium]MCB8983691.1 DUF2723 domain-containing protein [Ardenticatenaceae bacterium]